MESHLHLLFAQPFHAEYGDDAYHGIVAKAFTEWFADVYVPEVCAVSGVECVRSYEVTTPTYAHNAGLPSQRFLTALHIRGDVAGALRKASLTVERWARALPAVVDVENLAWMTYTALGDQIAARQRSMPFAEQHVTLTFSDPLRVDWASDAYNVALEETFNDWLEQRHLAEMLAIPGYIAARRYRRASTPLGSHGVAAAKYLTTYEFEGQLADVMALTGEHNRRWIASMPAGMGVASTRWQQYRLLAEAEAA